MAGRPLVIGIADLLRQPGGHRHLDRRVTLAGLLVSTASVPEDAEIVIDVELESMLNGLRVAGTLEVPWVGECRRCLALVEGRSLVEVREIFEPRPVEGETYPLGEDTVDLEPMIRDAVLLTLPLAPLCDADCRGPAPETFPALVADDDEQDGDESGSGAGGESSTRAPDPRWAALADLHFETEAPEG